MAQAQFVHDGDAIDYTPSSAIDAGEIIVQNDLVGIAKLDIPADELGALAVTGIYDVPRGAATAFNPGDEIYWDDDGTSEAGGTGAAVATSDGGNNPFMGYAVLASPDTAASPTVRILLRNDVSVSLAALADISDVEDGAPTAGDILIGDGSAWQATPVTGLVTLAADGATALADQAEGALGLPLILSKSFDGTVAEVHIFDGNCPRKLRIVDVWVEITAAGSSATTVTLDDGTDAITDAMDCYNGGAIGDKAVVRAGQIDDDYATLAVDATLDITVSDTTDAPAGIVRILAIPVA